MMNRSLGGKDIPTIECIDEKYNTYRVRWDIQPYINADGEEQGVSFLETEFTHKPTFDDIKQVILAWHNEQIDERILSGFVWRDMQVWLSSENQFNYKAAYDLAVQTGGANLPVTFKFGTTDEPVYHTFTALEELNGFYLSAMKYINDTLAEGWKEKDAIDWEKYKL